MAIATLAQYAAALKQRQIINKSAITNSTGTRWDGWYVNGVPATGTVPASTTAGTVPTNATAGAMRIDSFSGIGYVSAIELSQNVIPHLVLLHDRLWHAGPFVDTHGAYTLSSQPSFSSRIPGGTDYTGLQLWVESAAGINNSVSTITVTYTDQSGNTGHTTGAFVWVPPGTNTAGCPFQLPLQAGDCGIQLVESVNYTSNANNGSKVNVFIVRPLWQGALPTVELPPKTFGLEEIGMPQVWSDSCLSIMARNVGTVFGASDLTIEIASA